MKYREVRDGDIISATTDQGIERRVHLYIVQRPYTSEHNERVTTLRGGLTITREHNWETHRIKLRNRAAKPYIGLIPQRVLVSGEAPSEQDGIRRYKIVGHRGDRIYTSNRWSPLARSFSPQGALKRSLNELAKL